MPTPCRDCLEPTLIFLRDGLDFFLRRECRRVENVRRSRGRGTRKLLLIFEDYSLDRHRRELRRGGSLQHIEPQVFDLLLFLIDNRERVVSKDDLLASVWGGRTVSDSTLASRINAARRAVGDTGEQQRLIRTVHGRGFRFVGTIRETEERAGAVDCFAVAPAAQTEFRVPDRSPDVLTDAPTRSRRGRRASIAVMPFHASSQAAECVADGLSHDIISALARLRALLVIARGSTFALRERASNPREIGRALNVDYVATGSVLRTTVGSLSASNFARQATAASSGRRLTKHLSPAHLTSSVPSRRRSSARSTLKSKRLSVVALRSGRPIR